MFSFFDVEKMRLFATATNREAQLREEKVEPKHATGSFDGWKEADSQDVPMTFGLLKSKVSVFCNLPYIQHQEDVDELVDYLAQEGFLTAHILNLLASYPVRTAALTNTLISTGPMAVLSTLQTFASLRYLDLTCIHLDDLSLSCVASIRGLQSLHLDRTGLTSHGLSLLTPLAYTLCFLNIRYNPDVDDEGAQVLATFRLHFLLGIGTSITMYGISKIAEKLAEEDRRMGICLPEACDDYLLGLYHRPIEDVEADWDTQLKEVFDIVPEEEAFDWDAETTQNEDLLAAGPSPSTSFSSISSF